MKKIIEAPKEKWTQIAQRPVADLAKLTAVVQPIFQAIQAEGDLAVARYTQQFDGVALSNFKVSSEELAEAAAKVGEPLKRALEQAQQNIYNFHQAQNIQEPKVETAPGVLCWRENRPIEKVGIYVPGGSAPLFSTVLMLGIPAKIAGCEEVVLCTPPDAKGKIHPAILYAAQLIGITQIFKVGGIQAVGAMAFGTQSIPQVYKIFGPGNQYVMAAKQVAQNYGVAIDMPAGPSEVLVIADDSANPSFIAADLLSQAEHGPDSQVVLATCFERIADETLLEIEKQVRVLPRRDIAIKALESSKILVFKSVEACMQFSNLYAPEHLILAVEDARNVAVKVINAGSVFLGHYSCESAGDYASGTNHTLPTNGYAKAYSGVSLDSFVKKITFQELSTQGIRTIGKTVECMAEAEQLLAHKNAMTLRLNALTIKK